MTARSPDRYRAPMPVRTMLALILGPATCVTCLERYGSALHAELCEVAGG